MSEGKQTALILGTIFLLLGLWAAQAVSKLYDIAIDIERAERAEAGITVFEDHHTSARSRCTAVCGRAADAHCNVAADCVERCVEDSGACAEEMEAVLLCHLDKPVVCDPDANSEIGADNCKAERLALMACDRDAF